MPFKPYAIISNTKYFQLPLITLYCLNILLIIEKLHMSDTIKERLKGFIVPSILGIGLIALDKYLLTQNSSAGSGAFVFSEFVVVPILMGLIAIWYWRKLNLSNWTIFGYCTILTFTAILLSSVFLGEGVICLLIVSPLILLFIAIGAFIGNVIFKRNNQKLNLSIITLLLVIFLIDSLSPHEYENMVSDSIIINAPVNKVWKNVVEFKRINAPNKFWLFQLGLPSPVQSTVNGYYLGSKRKCIFSNGYVFDEKITKFDMNQNLTFAITNQPHDPEIMNHLDLLQGQFLLKDNGNGTITLTGNSWYRLYVFPTWYYNIWAQSIVRSVHIRVMQHIKELSEAK
jgi:hypothetical protein